MTTTPVLGVSEMAASQAQPHLVVNAGFRRLEQGANLFVVQAEVTAPPSSPADGECYLIRGTATGVFAGKEDQLAYYSGTGWLYITPRPGYRVWVRDVADSNLNADLIYMGVGSENWEPYDPVGGVYLPLAGGTISGDLTVQGNTSLGNASGDSLSITAGTWTFGANFTATRAAGALGAGSTDLLNTAITYTADAGGTTTARGQNLTITGSGANAATTQTAGNIISTWGGSNTLTTLVGQSFAAVVSDGGAATNIRAVNASIQLTSTGGSTTAENYRASAPTLSGSGVLATHIGFSSANLGHATLVTAVEAFRAADQTVNSTARGFRGQLTAGTGKRNVYGDGTAINHLNGALMIGSDTDDGVNKLQVTGSATVSTAFKMPSTAFTFSGGGFQFGDLDTGFYESADDTLQCRSGGTDVAKFNSTGLVGAYMSIPIACSDETTALTTGTAKVTFRMPHAFKLTAVRASLTTAQASGSIFTVDINEGGTTILSTKITVDNTEKTSTTAATPAVISDVDLADDAEITIDIDQVGDGTAVGLKVYLIGRPV